MVNYRKFNFPTKIFDKLFNKYLIALVMFILKLQ